MKIKNENRNENRRLIFFTLALLLAALLGLAAVLPGCSLIGQAVQKYAVSGNTKTGEANETEKTSNERDLDNSIAGSAPEDTDVNSGANTDLSTNSGAGPNIDSKEDSGQVSDAESETSAGPAANELKQEIILKGFYKLLEENKKPDELIKYIDENIMKSSTATAGSLCEGLENSQEYYSGIYMNYLFEGDAQQIIMETFTAEEDFIKENLDKISDINLKKQIALIFAGGFKFVAVEGSFYPIIDYEYLKKYAPYLDDEFNAYLDIKAVESNEIYSRDAGLMISWDKLAKRVADAENYISKYPEETPRKIKAGKLYLGYLASYIYGQNNTPTRDYSTNKVYDEVIESYKGLIENSRNTLTGKIIAEYFDVLQKNGFVLSDDILNSLEKYLKIPVLEYNLDSDYMISWQLKNISYPLDLAALGYISLQNGQYREKPDEQSAEGLEVFLLDLYDIGDLNNDGINDAAVILVADPGGMKTFYYLHAIQNGYFYIYSIDQELLGEWVKIESISIKDGKIYIKMATNKQEDIVCCPTDTVTRVYKLQDGQMIEN